MPTRNAKTADGEVSAAGEATPKRVRKAAAPQGKSPQPGAAATETAEPAAKAPRRKSAAPKPGAAAAEESGTNGVSHLPISTEDISTEDISVRAYFIAENRQFLGLPGDPESDWLEAERQLRSEATGIATSLGRSRRK
jgi:hypothetical protein